MSVEMRPIASTSAGRPAHRSPRPRELFSPGISGVLLSEQSGTTAGKKSFGTFLDIPVRHLRVVSGIRTHFTIAKTEGGDFRIYFHSGVPPEGLAHLSGAHAVRELPTKVRKSGHVRIRLGQNNVMGLPEFATSRSRQVQLSAGCDFFEISGGTIQCLAVESLPVSENDSAPRGARAEAELLELPSEEAPASRIPEFEEVLAVLGRVVEGDPDQPCLILIEYPGNRGGQVSYSKKDLL